VVARVASKHVIELNVIDFVCSLCLESLLNNCKFFLANLHFEIVKDRSETSESNESTSASVFVLEERLDQQASVLNISAQTLECANQNFFFSSVKDILWIKNRGCIEGVDTGGWVLFQVYICENGIELLRELSVVDQTSVVGKRIVVFETGELGGSKGDSLRVENTTELLSGDIALAKDIMILEELIKSDSVFFDDLFDLGHQSFMRLFTVEVCEFVFVSRLGIGCGSMDHVFQAVGIL